MTENPVNKFALLMGLCHLPVCQEEGCYREIKNGAFLGIKTGHSCQSVVHLL